MDKVYLIISGRYSDWSIEGYSNSREKAELICYTNNKRVDDDYYHWYVMSADEMDIETENEYVYWNYEIELRNDGHGYVLNNDLDYYVKCNNKAQLPEIKHQTAKNYLTGAKVKYATIRWSNTRFLSFEEAQKVAYDMLMQDLDARVLEGEAEDIQ